MSLVTCEKVTKYYGEDRILDCVSFAVDRSDRIGLVGRNGGGKTTLLSILCGCEEPDEGSVSVASGARVEMLAQDAEYCPDNSIWDETRSALYGLAAAESRLLQVEADLASARAHQEELGDLLSRYARAEEDFRLAGGYDWHVKVATVLTGLGFAPSEFDSKMTILSSGQRVRVALAKVLLLEPAMLLLDEPTKHLDVDASEWLEERLRSYPGAVIAVSHDRFFLNNVCKRILELENNVLAEYKGNYDAYVEQREFRREQQETAYVRHSRKVSELKEYIRRYKAGQRTAMAKSREKWLARLGHVDRPVSRKPVSIDFVPASELGKTVFIARGLSKKYGEKTVFSGLDFRVSSQDRIGIIGKNGVGKTTLLKVLLGIEEATDGRVWTGPSAEFGYFHQDLDTLDPQKTVLDELMDGTDLLPGPARSILGAFLFSGDDVYKRTDALSGGERNRLTLAKMVLGGHNVLMLDEPTNHLDMDSKEALARALVEFNGCVLFVTHDRQFLQDVATRILELDEMGLQQYRGDYLAYREEKRRRKEPALDRTEAVRSAARPEARDDTRAAGGASDGLSAAKPRLGDPVRRRLAVEAWQRAIEQAEQEIAHLEQEKAHLESRLQDPETYRTGAAQETLREYDEVQKSLQARYEEWEKLHQSPPSQQ